jgi:hypothetical protein
VRGPLPWTLAFERMVGRDHPVRGKEREFMVKAQRFFAGAAVPAIRENVETRAALSAPEGDEREVAAIIAAGRQAVAEFEGIAADRGRLRALFTGKISDPAARFDGLSRRYGIDNCAGEE